jgi:hypothetical protein
MSTKGAQLIVAKEKRPAGNFNQVSVGVGATLLAARNDNRIDLAVINTSGATIFIGPSTVTVANGVPIGPSAGISFDSFTGALYGIVAAGSETVGVIEI